MLKYLILFVFCTYIVFARNTEGINKADTSKYIQTTFTFLIGFPFPSQSGGFKDVYLNVLKGQNTYYPPSALLTVKFQLLFNSFWKFGIVWETFDVEFRDNYTHYFTIADETIYRSYNQRLDIRTSPLLLTVEYSPAITPYKSYLGAGMGVSFGNIYWYETVSSNLSNDIRKSGEVYNGSPISPAVKLYSGVLLNFDKKSERDFLGAVHFELSINYVFRSLKIYENLTKQYVSPPKEFYDRYFVLPFYLSLSAGISFNLFHKLKN